MKTESTLLLAALLRRLYTSGAANVRLKVGLIVEYSCCRLGPFKL